jgi:hypothetical protein
MSSKKFNIFISSKNRDRNEKIYDFNLYLRNQILVGKNEGININVMSFSMLNSMYNVNSITKNNTFIIRRTDLDGISNIIEITITIPFGNYSVITLRDVINSLLVSSSLSNISLSYNIPTNTYTFNNNNSSNRWFIIPNSCNKLLGVSTIIEITSNYTGTFVNMVNYEQIIIRCPSLNFENLNQDNIRDKNNSLNISDILFTINKADTEPYRTISYKNEDAGTSYSYNITNNNLSTINLQLFNENDELITDAPDYLLELQIIVYDKTDNVFQEIGIQSLSLLDDIYFTLLNILFKKNNYLL